MCCWSALVCRGCGSRRVSGRRTPTRCRLTGRLSVGPAPGRHSLQSLAVAEPLNGPIMGRYQALARELGLWMSLGGFQERGPDAEHLHNTHVILDSRGERAAVYRKVHLFDVEVPNGPILMESRFTAPGTQVRGCREGGEERVKGPARPRCSLASGQAGRTGSPACADLGVGTPARELWSSSLGVRHESCRMRLGMSHDAPAAPTPQPRRSPASPTCRLQPLPRSWRVTAPRVGWDSAPATTSGSRSCIRNWHSKSRPSCCSFPAPSRCPLVRGGAGHAMLA